MKTFICAILFISLPALGNLESHIRAHRPIRSLAPNTTDKTCKAAYRRLFSKPEIDVRVIFGYKDARPARFVGDRQERAAFVEQLISPCVEGVFACGFTRSKEDADIFRKSIIGPSGDLVSVRVQVVHSSVGPDDEENRANPFQEWQSQYAEEVFLTGLETADIVFYNGHSRAGGGPDFSPPRLTADKAPDFFYYQKHRPGLGKILYTLGKKKTDGGLKLIGLFSCASTRLFANQIITKRPKAGVITSPNLVFYVDALENSLAALSGILEMRCEGDFKAVIKQGHPKSGSQITGFFAE